MKKVVTNIAVLLIVFSFHGCSTSSTSQTNSGLGSGPSTTQSSKAITHTVEMTGDYEFVPSALMIKQGDSVKWVLVEGAHTTTSGTVNKEGEGVPDGIWDSDIMNSGSFTYTFNSTGTFPYFCTPHSEVGMIGTIAVQ